MWCSRQNALNRMARAIHPSARHGESPVSKVARAQKSRNRLVNHHGSGLLIWLALPFSDLDGRDLKQVLSVSEIPLVTALPKLAAFRTTKQIEPQPGILCNLGKAPANLRRVLDAPSFDLDTDRLGIRSITADGQAIPYTLGEPDPVLGQRLRLELPPGTREVEIDYATSPEAIGLQWLSPSQTTGKKFPFMFSQCQPHRARSLAPLQDSPRVRVPYHAEVVVPEALTAVMSAGAPIMHAGQAAGTRTFEFDMPQPIPTYLIAIAVG